MIFVSQQVKGMKNICQKTRKILFLLFTILLLTSSALTAQAAASQSITKQAKSLSGTFVKDSKGIRYKLTSGKYAKSMWLLADGEVYRLKSNGYVRLGWFKFKGKYYYSDKKTGSLEYSKFVTINNKTYYLKNDGTRASKIWVRLGGKYYYFNKSGVLQKNKMFSVGKNYYYASASGVRLESSFMKISGKTYYFNASGIRVQGKWVKIGGNYYYFAPKTGVMAKNTWVGDYYAGSDGARLTNCKVGAYTLGADGKKTTASVSSSQTSGKVLFVGDSRTVGMKNSVSASSRVSFTAKVSMGYSWLIGTADTTIKAALKKNPSMTVVFGLGVNDLGNIHSYISYYNKLIRSYPDAEFVFLAVNPITYSNAYISNSKIAAFNKMLKNAFGSRYLDTNTWMTKNGFSTVDGLHYTTETYKKLYSYIMKNI